MFFSVADQSDAVLLQNLPENKSADSQEEKQEDEDEQQGSAVKEEEKHGVNRSGGRS